MGGAGGTGTGGAGGTSGSGGVTISGGGTSPGGTTSSGGTTGAGGSTRTGGATAFSPADAGFDQAVDAPQADAPRAGAGGNGGTTAAGGSTRTGGATGTGGTTASSPADAGLDGRVDGVMDVKSADAFLGTDAAANSCDNPLPLQCGDRLNHSTLVQGRADVWRFYGCSQRVMSGPEAIYFLQLPSGCKAFMQLKNFTADLALFPLTSCSFMSCTFATEIGQPSFVVVDGFDGAAGSYTLEVDCTCNDAGTSDVPQADAQGDTAIAPGCDLDVASKAIAASGVTPVGAPQTSNVTLPTTMATDDNWGLKETICQQGGYDIAPLAGKTVCLVGQDITQLCQRNPASAWVLINNGAVACVYKTVRKGFAATPGVYPVTDPSCTQPTIAAGATVLCGGPSCTSATGTCCPSSTLMNRLSDCWLDSNCSPSVSCDGPEDCANGDVCCSLESASAGFVGGLCVRPAECVAPSRVICHQDAGCPSQQHCGVPNPMPAAVPEYPPQDGTPVYWLVDFQVCAP